MAENKCIRTKVGNVFTIPLTPDKVGYGQVAAGEHIVFYMLAFDYTTTPTEQCDIDAMTSSPMIFAGNFLDNSIKRGKWKVVGNRAPNLTRMPFPAYRVKIGDDYWVESWDMRNRRLANEVEIALLDNRTHYAPVCLEAALKAYYGLAPRPKWYEELTLGYVQLRSKVAF
jgi:hypothetical protein